MSIYQNIIKAHQEKRGLLSVLIDPDKTTPDEANKISQNAENMGIDIILVGGSLLTTDRFHQVVSSLKEKRTVPIVIFPGTIMQISKDADAILFLSLISGRNPEYLIGNQVIASPMIKAAGIEPISTGYMMIESGNQTSASFMSNSFPIPRNKPDIASAHALAAEYLGMKQIYLEGGSGAELSVPNEMVQHVSNHTNLPIWVGGGIKTPQEARIKVESGATVIVIGTHFEKNNGHTQIESFANEIKQKVK